jgi:flagellar biogenesis protein FliO
MKFIRNGKLRDRLVDILSKILLIGISVLVCLWMVSGAHAEQVSITGIKAVPKDDGSIAIAFGLSRKLGSDSVAVEFERNFIQVSLKGVSAYPARTEKPADQRLLEKIFTYQYQPDLARARVLLRGPASAVKSRTTWAVSEEGLNITVAAATAAIADANEERIVRAILDESKPVAAPATPVAAEELPIFAAKGAATEAAKSRETPATRLFASLLLVIGLIGATATGYRRFALGKRLAFRKQGKIIDVVASQGIGPKRSVALVKVLDQYMVIGMAGEGMSLLANLGSDVKIEKYLDQAGGPGDSFTEAFDGAMSSAPLKTDAAGQPILRTPVTEPGIRAAIKKRIEGFKPL